jgi:hypothetical protein
MMRTAIDDLRAAGWGAPVRALYEAGKRAGGHRVVLGRLVRSSRAASPPRLRSPFLVPVDPPPEAQRRALAEAARIADGTISVYGRELTYTGVPDWHGAIEGDGRWPVVPWWQIDLRSPARTGDVKWTWELARHRHLVVLARAAALDPGNQRWNDVLRSHLRSWIDENPLELGVHWASNLELSLRAIAWLQIIALVGSRLDPALRDEMARVLWHTGRHLVVELPYTMSTMANNHLLGDALGLGVLGRAFDHPQARRWARLGDRLFARQARREFRDDGSTIDESLSYQRFVMEMAITRALLDDRPDAALVSQLTRSANYLARLGVLDGPVPAYGDWDEGRVLVVSPETSDRDAGDLSGTVLAALAVAGSGGDPTARERYDEVGWYAAPGTPLRPDEAVTAGQVGGGIARVRGAGFTVWLRGGERLWHGHADLGSVEIADEHGWAVVDPGTGSYNGDPVVRDGFRSSAAHSVTRVLGLDQLEPHRVFRWRHSGRAVLGDPIVLGTTAVVWCVHDAYARLDPPRLVVRAVLVDRVDGDVTVADWLSGPSAVPYALNLPLGPDRRWQPDTDHPNRGRVLDRSGNAWHVATQEPAAAAHGRPTPWAGWFSSTYGSVIPATALSVTGVARGPILWVLSRDPASRWRVEGEGLVRTGADGESSSIVTLDWADTVIRLRVGQGGRQWVGTAPVRAG